MRKILVTVGTAALVSMGVATAYAQDRMPPPGADIRSEEPPIDVTPEQLRAQRTPMEQGRSVERVTPGMTTTPDPRR